MQEFAEKAAFGDFKGLKYTKFLSTEQLPETGQLKSGTIHGFEINSMFNEATGELSILPSTANYLRSVGFEISETDDFAPVNLNYGIGETNVAFLRLKDLITAAQSHIDSATQLNYSNENKCNHVYYMIPFLAFDGFGQVYNDYLLDRDEAVFVRQPLDNSFLDHHGLQQLPDLSPICTPAVSPADTIKFTREVMQGAAYMIALAMVKAMDIKITVGKESQIEATGKSRINSLAQALGVRHLTFEKVKKVINVEYLSKLTSDFSFFPKLKSVIFRFLVFSKGPIFDHMRLIFDSMNIMVFRMIFDFLYSDRITAAHVDPRTMEEIYVWSVSFLELVDKYQEKWRFYKLLEPTGSLTNHSKFKRLAGSAWAFAVMQADSLQRSTFRNIRGLGKPNAIALMKVATDIKADPTKERFLERRAEWTTSIKKLCLTYDIIELATSEIPLEYADADKQELVDLQEFFTQM